LTGLRVRRVIHKVDHRRLPDRTPAAAGRHPDAGDGADRRPAPVLSSLVGDHPDLTPGPFTVSRPAGYGNGRCTSRPRAGALYLDRSDGTDRDAWHTVAGNALGAAEGIDLIGSM
jgi:hypothetical protein